jgi:hypothetical protein
MNAGIFEKMQEDEGPSGGFPAVSSLEILRRTA